MKRIIPAEAGLLKQLILLDQKNLAKDAWQEFSWKESIENPRYYSWVFYQDSLPIGFSLFQVIKEDQFAHLLKIVIDSSFRGRGLGKELLTSNISILATQGIRSFYLELRASNTGAFSLYQSMGFKECRKIKDFYSDGESAWSMLLQVNSD